MLNKERTLAYTANHGGPDVGITCVALLWDKIRLVEATKLFHVIVDDPCHVALHPSEKFVFTSSYSFGTVTVVDIE